MGPFNNVNVIMLCCSSEQCSQTGDSVLPFKLDSVAVAGSLPTLQYTLHGCLTADLPQLDLNPHGQERAKLCFHLVSNWGPFSCEANVITTTLQKPENTTVRGAAMSRHVLPCPQLLHFYFQDWMGGLKPDSVTVTLSLILVTANATGTGTVNILSAENNP